MKQKIEEKLELFKRELENCLQLNKYKFINKTQKLKEIQERKRFVEHAIEILKKLEIEKQLEKKIEESDT